MEQPRGSARSVFFLQANRKMTSSAAIVLMLVVHSGWAQGIGAFENTQYECASPDAVAHQPSHENTEYTGASLAFSVIVPSLLTLAGPGNPPPGALVKLPYARPSTNNHALTLDTANSLNPVGTAIHMFRNATGSNAIQPSDSRYAVTTVLIAARSVPARPWRCGALRA